MSDLNNDLFEEMLNDYLPEEKKSGDVISGIITRKDMDFAYLDYQENRKVEFLSVKLRILM